MGDDRPGDDRLDIGRWVRRPVPASVRGWLSGAGFRWSPSPRAVLGLGLVGVLTVAVAVVVGLHSRPRPVSVPRAAAATAAPRASAASAGSAGPASGAAAGLPAATGSPAPSASGSAGQVVVDVAGRVRHPGVVRLPAGSRVVDAIAAAGGLSRRLRPGAVNLAAPLTDGEQVLVGVSGAVPAAGAGAAPAAGTGSTGAAGVVDLNTATLADLDGLPDIGPVLAQRILDWRTVHGGFRSIDQLSDVSGIGDATMADLRGHVGV